MNTPKSAPVMYLVGRRRWWPVWGGHGDKLWHRLRYPFTRRTLLHVQGVYNPKTLAREKKILDKKPIWWALGLAALAVLPPLASVGLESNSLLSAAAIFALYAAINLVWMLIIGTAGTVDRMVVYTKDKKRVRYPMTLLQRTPVQYDSIFHKTTYFCRLGVTEVVYPETIGYFDGI
jgi:hypothetical protein